MTEDNERPGSPDSIASNAPNGSNSAPADSSASPEVLFASSATRKTTPTAHRYDLHHLLNNSRYTRRLLVGLGIMLLFILAISLGFVTGFFDALTTLLLTGAVLAVALLVLVILHWWRKFKSKV